MCTLARVGLITPAAREAARRRQVAMRMEAQMKEERKAQWMASLRGPGWARRGRCHGMWRRRAKNIFQKNNFHVCNQKSTNQFIEYHFLINVGRRSFQYKVHRKLETKTIYMASIALNHNPSQIWIPPWLAQVQVSQLTSQFSPQGRRPSWTGGQTWYLTIFRVEFSLLLVDICQHISVYTSGLNDT